MPHLEIKCHVGSLGKAGKGVFNGKGAAVGNCDIRQICGTMKPTPFAKGGVDLGRLGRTGRNGED